MSRHVRAFAWVSLALCLSACATTESPGTSTGMRSLKEVAASLHLEIRPTGFAEDRLLVRHDGASFYVMADRPYYRFRGDERNVGARARVDGDDLVIPAAMVAAFRSDLASLKKEPPPSTPVRPVVKKPRPKRPRVVRPKATGLSGAVIVVDPGHGGKDPGAMHGGVREKDVNLSVSRRVVKMLRDRGAKVIATRANDSYPSLDARANLANARRARLFVSIHANAAPRRSATGVMVLYRADGSRGRRSLSCARLVCDAIVATTGAKNLRARADQRGLRVLRKTRMPAILVETGFLSNAAERKRLSNSSYQERLARGIVNGIARWVARDGATARR